MKITHIRHATFLLQIGGKKILVDPMLNNKGTYRAVEKVPNTNMNPLVELPVTIETLSQCDAILVTNTHANHFNEESAKLLPKNIPVFCQPEDYEILSRLGFKLVNPIDDNTEWEKIRIKRTGGKHGYGTITKRMAPVSGYILSVIDEPVVYITGVTVWCSCVKKALDEKPDIVIAFCGAARFRTGKPITMNDDDVLNVCNYLPSCKVVAIHMEAWNHCRLTRAELQKFAVRSGIESRVIIPHDGEIIEL
jgi:L-ascorbate metabolism protein UlaG (beta-lactamase superfamily)